MGAVHLLVAESTNTYQQSLFNGRPFIHGLGRSFSIAQLPEGILSPKAKDFESKYLAVQNNFESGDAACPDSIIKEVLTAIIQEHEEAKEYFNKLSEVMVSNKQDKIGSLLLHLHDKDLSIPTQEQQKSIPRNPELFEKITKKLSAIKNDPDFAPPGYDNEITYHYRKENLKSIDIFMAIQSNKFNTSFWRSLRQVITRHLELPASLKE